MTRFDHMLPGKREMTMLRLAAIAIFAFTAVPAAAQSEAAKSSPAAAPAMPAPLYLLMYERGPKWVAGKPIHEQKLGEHVAYMQGLIRDGKVVAGGPFGSGTGGMAILRAASADEAQAVLAKDPALLNGTFVGSITEWTPFLDSNQPLRR